MISEIATYTGVLWLSNWIVTETLPSKGGPSAKIITKSDPAFPVSTLYIL